MKRPTEESYGNRRASTRLPADGMVELSFADPLPVTISGRLLDVSSGGFRAAHACADIHTGLEVRFSHQRAAGAARVVWNRIVEGCMESGFALSDATNLPKR